MRKAMSRREFLKAGLAGSGLLLAGCSVLNSAETLLPLTPACGDDGEHDFTLRNAEGPFFTPDSPENRAMREVGYDADLLTVSGMVLSAECTPIANALVDFWHADPNGEYDNVGYKFRAHQFTDADGRYELQTLMPGLYPGRTRHLHVKVQAPNGPVLTTQLYFPGEPDNFDDDLIIQSLIMEMQTADTSQEQVGVFNFVVRA